MPRTTNRKQEQKNIEFTVKNCREFADGGISFALVLLDGKVTLYGCRVINGKEGEFIAFPARKGQNEKWYNHFFVDLSKEETAEIINVVYETLDNA